MMNNNDNYNNNNNGGRLSLGLEDKFRGRYRTPPHQPTQSSLWHPIMVKSLSVTSKELPFKCLEDFLYVSETAYSSLDMMNRVEHAAWILCLEFFPTWFLKNNCNGNINQRKNNDNNYNDNNNDSNSNKNYSNYIFVRLKKIVRRWHIKFKKREIAKNRKQWQQQQKQQPEKTKTYLIKI